MAVAVETHVEVVDAGALRAVSVQPADGADELVAGIVASVSYRSLEDGTARFGLQSYRVIRPRRTLVLPLLVVAAPHFSVDDPLELERRALRIIFHEPVQLAHEKSRGVLDSRIIERDIVASVAHAPVFRNSGHRASPMARYRQEPADASGNITVVQILASLPDTILANLARIQYIDQRLVKVERRRQACDVSAHVTDRQ